MLKITTVDDYALTVNCKHNSPIKVEGLCGRIIRGKKLEDFLTLTDDPTRKIVMLVDETGLEKLVGKTGYEMLIEVGYEPDYLKHKVQEGNQFKLIVFPEGGSAKLATWDNVANVIDEVYPDLGINVALYCHSLSSMTYKEAESYVGYKLIDVEKK